MATLLHVIHRSGTGGLETLLLRLLPLLQRAHSADVLVLQAPGDLHAAFKRVARRLFVSGPRGRLRKLARWWSIFRRYRGALVHLHHTGPISIGVARCAGCKKIIYHIHGTRRKEHKWGRLTERLGWWLCGNIPSIYIANSHTTRDAMTRRRFTTRRIEVVYNGVDFETFRPSVESRVENWPMEVAVGRKVILYAGRFTRGKNLFTWLEVAQRVNARHPETYFVLAGDGPMRPALERYAKTLGLERACWFPGFCDQMPALFARSDLFFFLSAWESFGLAVLEAVACGVPVLVSDIPAMRELLGDRDGCFVSSPAPEDMVEQVWERLENYERWRGEAIRLRDELGTRFDISETGQRLTKLYRTLESKSGAAR